MARGRMPETVRTQCKHSEWQEQVIRQPDICTVAIDSCDHIFDVWYLVYTHAFKPSHNAV
jgi:hypothetical protein